MLYLDGGWQTIVDGLRRMAVASGVRIISAAHAVALEQSTARQVEAVRLADGTAMHTSAVIVASGPADVDLLAGTRFTTALPPPIRVATLDLALRSLPKPNATVAFGVDAPVYTAELSPDGSRVVVLSITTELADRSSEEAVRRRAYQLIDDTLCS